MSQALLRRDSCGFVQSVSDRCRVGLQIVFRRIRTLPGGNCAGYHSATEKRTGRPVCAVRKGGCRILPRGCRNIRRGSCPVFGDGWPKPPFGTGLVVSGMDGALSVQVCVHLVFEVEIIKMKINLQYLGCCIYVFLSLTLKVQCAGQSDRSVHAPLCGSFRIRTSGTTV